MQHGPSKNAQTSNKHITHSYRNNPGEILWGKPTAILKQLEPFLAENDKMKFNKLVRLTTEELFREASQAHIYNLSIELNAKSTWSRLIAQINAGKITCQQAIELVGKDALHFKEAFAAGLIDSKNNPTRAIRILVLNSNKSMLAGTLTKNLTKNDTK